MIYLLENTDLLNNEFISAAICGLSLQRLKRLDELGMEPDRINCAAAYLMLRYALKREYGIKEAPEFTFGKNGKPYLKNESGIYFSLSHCRNSCACVVSGSETAVDIADIRRISDRTAKYFCTKEELEAVNSSENKENELVKLWAVKECYSKLDGSGLHMDYRSIGEKEKAMIKVIKGERYFAAVCCKEDAKAVKLTAEQCLSF